MFVCGRWDEFHYADDQWGRCWGGIHNLYSGASWSGGGTGRAVEMGREVEEGDEGGELRVGGELVCNQKRVHTGNGPKGISWFSAFHVSANVVEWKNVAGLPHQF